MNDLEKILKRLDELEAKIDRIESNTMMKLPFIQFYPDVCLDGQPHRYPSPWMATVPPSCEKCGYPASQQTFTYTT